MSLYDYQQSQIIYATDVPFYSLIMAAMRQADPINLSKLKQAFPDIHEEFKERYNAPGGLIQADNDGYL